MDAGASLWHDKIKPCNHVHGREPEDRGDCRAGGTDTAGLEWQHFQPDPEPV